MAERTTALSEKRVHLDFLCESLHMATGLSVFLFNEHLTCIFCLSKWETQLKNFFFLNCPNDLNMIMHRDNTPPFYYCDSLHLNWIVLPVSCYRAFYVLGPSFETEITPSFFQKKMEFQKMSVSSQIQFLHMNKDIPVIPNIQMFRYASMLYYALYGQLLNLHTILLSPDTKSNLSKQPLTPPISAEKMAHSIPQSHGSRVLEKIMLQSVKTGDLSTFSNHIAHSFSDTIVGTMAVNDPLRQAKNAIIAQVTLVTRAAVDGGMDAEAAFSLSDYFIQQIEICTTSDEVYAISGEMYQTFVQKVHDARTAHFTPLTAFMCTYIDKHIFEKISLDSLADDLGYDMYYLTTIFRKDTGCTIKQYILEKKVAQAKIMLASTLMEVQEVSDRLAFSSASYFCTQFKKIAGESPLSYRKNRNNRI